jgi:hypothetical protein
MAFGVYDAPCGGYFVAEIVRVISVAAATLAWSMPRCSVTVTVPSGEVVVVVVETQEARVSVARARIIFMV